MLYVTFEENISLQIFLAIVAVIVTIGLTILLGFFILKERKRWREETMSYIEGIQTLHEISTSLSSYIAKNAMPEFSLIQLDVDKFTALAENFGKDEGENIIRSLAFRLKEVMPARVEIARTGTDKFLLFLRGDYSHDDAKALAKKLLTIVAQPIIIFNDTQVQLTCSIAVAFYPNHGMNVKELTESLEIANYLCKRDGGNQMRVYSIEQGNKESENLKYYTEIKNAIKNKEFCLYYQPMVDVKNEKILGAEGLIRWNHPELGVLSPFKFINILEQSGDIKWVGEWGLECLIREYIKCKEMNFQKDKFVFSLNLSPKQLTDPELPQSFNKLLKKYKIEAAGLMLEISEFTIFDKHELIKNNILALKTMGFNIAVDGYGLDFNGIKKLLEMKVDMVKLDKEYMDPETDQNLKEQFINMLIDFATKYNIKIVGEGIEDYKELDYARSLGITYQQGYNFAKPMPEEELENYLKTSEFKKRLVPTEEVVTPEAQAIKSEEEPENSANENKEAEENEDTALDKTEDKNEE